MSTFNSLTTGKRNRLFMDDGLLSISPACCCQLVKILITLSLNIFYFNFMTYIHKCKRIRTEAKSLISSSSKIFSWTNVMALNQFQMLKAQKANIKETYLIEYTTTIPPCNCYSLVQNEMSQCMRFPTMWHFDMCRLGWTSAVSL